LVWRPSTPWGVEIETVPTYNADCSDTAADFFVHGIKVSECVVDCLANVSTHASAGNKLASSVVFNH
jgi:hypothetical protein